MALLSLWFIFLVPFIFGDAQTEGITLKAMRGYDAYIPCGIPFTESKKVKSIVTWSKNNLEFKYDKDSKWSLGCGIDANLKICQDEKTLHLRKVSDKDGGLYKCRINEINSSPDVDVMINIHVIDPPGKPRIYDKFHNEITSNTIGPYKEGDSLSFLCEAKLGDTSTTLYWLRDNTIIKKIESKEYYTSLSLHYQVDSIDHDELGVRYACLAQNSDISDPLGITFGLDFISPPRSVELRLNNNNNFAVGEPRVIDCLVIGCSPSPQIIWYLNHTPLKKSSHKEKTDGNYTLSTINIIPTIKDNKKILTCRAFNKYLPNNKFDDTVEIKVGYKPKCSYETERVYGVIEGVKESIRCSVISSKPPTKFTWRYGETPAAYTTPVQVTGVEDRFISELDVNSSNTKNGQLNCKASNMFGEQNEPCLYKLLKGGPPDKPQCDMTRSYPFEMNIACRTAFDGGRPLTYHLTLINTETNVTILTRTTKTGLFLFNNVNKDQNVTAVVYSFTVRGRSEKVIMHLEVPPFPAYNVDYNSDDDIEHKWTLIFWFVSAATFLIIILITALCGRSKSDDNRTVNVVRINDDNNPVTPPEAEGQFHREPNVDERTYAPITTISNYVTYTDDNSAKMYRKALCAYHDKPIGIEAVTYTDDLLAKAYSGAIFVDNVYNMREHHSIEV